jgi:hypothetical protein
MDWGAYAIRERCDLCGNAILNRIIDRAVVTEAGKWRCFACTSDHSWQDQIVPTSVPGWDSFKPSVQFWWLYEWWLMLRYRKDRAAGVKALVPPPVDFQAPIPSGYTVDSMARLVEEMA